MPYFISILLLIVPLCLVATEAVSNAPLEEEVITNHTANIRGATISYRATAGTLPLKEEQGEVKGRIFYIAYERTDVENQAKRPIAFCFNGGPGAASIWLHLGLLGPKRVHIHDDKFNPPPYSYRDNEFSLLDQVDLVFIDPISTGYSRTSVGQDSKAFHSVDGDVKWLSEWIRLYTTHKGRWASPKFLVGESYGTIRAIQMADSLHDNSNMYLNGIILISSVLDFQTLDKLDKGNDLPLILSLPSYAATAWFHKKLSPELQSLSLDEVLRRVHAFATEEYSVALLIGDLLAEKKRKEVAEKLGSFMGLSTDYIEKSHLRVPLGRYSKELLRNESQVIGRFDGRFKGYSPDSLAENSHYDPSLNMILGSFTAAAHSYFENDLKWIKDLEYRVLTSSVQPWDYGKFANRYLNATPTLRDLLIGNPDLHVFVAAGYYDLATPYYASKYSFDHLYVDSAAKARVAMKTYEGGHMMYLSVPILEKLSADLHLFIAEALEKQVSSP